MTMNELGLLNDRYRLDERLGSGGMAEVFRATDLTLERTVAIKILRKDYFQNPEFRSRFHQEAKAAANLSHQNIVTVYDFGYAANQLFIVMEYVPGEDLKTKIKAKQRFSISEAIELIGQACSGLGYAHRAGLVHCDVKPQNMLVTPDGRLKVVDFGIARALATISPDEKMDVVWGSPQYFSPEQASGNPPSPSSDVYSLGVILYEMLAGRLPFVANTPQELTKLHRQALPPSPRRFNHDIPVSLEQIILKVLSKEPAARYRTADHLGRVLTSFIEQMTSTSQSRAPSGEMTTFPPGYLNAPSPPPTTVQHHQPGQPFNGLSTLDIEDPNSDLIHITMPQSTPRVDWLTWLLVLLALLAVGGLVPFWMWVAYILKPPI